MSWWSKDLTPRRICPITINVNRGSFGECVLTVSSRWFTYCKVDIHEPFYFKIVLFCQREIEEGGWTERQLWPCTVFKAIEDFFFVCKTSSVAKGAGRLRDSYAYPRFGVSLLSRVLPTLRWLHNHREELFCFQTIFLKIYVIIENVTSAFTYPSLNTCIDQSESPWYLCYCLIKIAD